MHPVQLALVALGVYLLVGLVFGVVFALAGSVRIDPAAGRTTARVRVLFVPGAAALWPVVLMTWLNGARRGEDGA